jgi:hypothetical protein
MTTDYAEYICRVARREALPIYNAEPGSIWWAELGTVDQRNASIVILLVLESPNPPGVDRRGGLVYGQLFGLGAPRLGWRDIDRTHDGAYLGSEWIKLA